MLQAMIFWEDTPVLTPKDRGAFYTPDDVVRSLVCWAVRRSSDRMLDPSCGDGRFLAAHPNSVGVEQDPAACELVHARSPGSLIHQGDFFAWAAETRERFDCAAGNPPFIRYQKCTGEVRDAAYRLCARHGAKFSALASSWAPFLVATATLLRPGGRMAFVMPAEIGHAPYALPVLEYLFENFRRVQVVAVRDKLFPELSEDCWLLYAEEFGACTDSLILTALERFRFMTAPPRTGLNISRAELSAWSGRLRPFLASARAREVYLRHTNSAASLRFGSVARVGIGYVTGANDFFHLRPSQAEELRIPHRLLHPSVRNGRSLSLGDVTEKRVRDWVLSDDPVYLLRLRREDELPIAVKRYLDCAAAREAQESYKCRNRDPWWVVPDVKVPDGFLSYMSGEGPTLVRNPAGCVCTNSVHAVQLNGRIGATELARRWRSPLTALSCELEGHPLGGGMLKLEPGEASRLLLTEPDAVSKDESEVVMEGVRSMRQWRNYGDGATALRMDHP